MRQEARFSGSSPVSTTRCVAFPGNVGVYNPLPRGSVEVTWPDEGALSEAEPDGQCIPCIA
jgi:hypothetical protein